MTMTEFEAAIASRQKPPGLPAPLEALWWDAVGDWERAHAVAAADESGAAAAWVHAYLHRREGDAFNARYWYGRAQRPVSTLALDDERRAIVETLLPS